MVQLRAFSGNCSKILNNCLPDSAVRYDKSGKRKSKLNAFLLFLQRFTMFKMKVGNLKKCKNYWQLVEFLLFNEIRKFCPCKNKIHQTSRFSSI